MSANEEKSLIEQIKYYRRFSRPDSSDSEDDGMASPENNGNDVFSTDDGRRRSCPETPNIQDSGVHDLSCASTEPSGARTPISSADGASCHADCIFKLPTNENQLSELADGSLSTYTCTSQNDESTLLPEPSLSDEANENNAYDFSTRVNANSGLLSDPIPGASTGETTGENVHKNIPSSLQGELPCDIFYINEQTDSLQAFQTFSELSEYLVDAAAEQIVDDPNSKSRYRTSQNVLQKIVRLPLESMGSYITVGEYLRHLYEKDKLMDVAVHVKDKTFSAHRVALSCYSEYFAELFSRNKGRKIPFEMRLRGITPEAFAIFLEFVYTGQLKVYDIIAADLIIIADFLKVETLKQRCTTLAENLPIEQALKLVVKCQGGNSGRIYKTVFHKLLQNFNETTQLPGILELDVDTFCQMMSSDDLFVQSEYEAFQMAVRWLVHNMEERVKYTIRVMNLVRFCYMTAEELITCVETTSLIRGYDKFREIILIANWILTVHQLKRDDPFQFPKPPPRNCYITKFIKTNERRQSYDVKDNFPAETLAKIVPTTEEQHSPLFTPLMTSTPKPAKHAKPVMLPTELQTQVKTIPRAVDILVIGGFHTDDDKFVERYDSEDNQWVHFCRLPEPRRQHTVASLGNKLYLIGGSDPRTPGATPMPTASTFLMDLAKKEWKRVSDMNVARMDHCACTLFGMIYAIGGIGEHKNALGSVECYNPQTDNWHFVTPLASARSCSTAAALRGKIYVVGGLGENVHNTPSSINVLNTVEVFDPTENSWSTRKNLRFPRCKASIVNVNDRLFLCGGATRSYDYKSSVLHSVASVDEYIEEHDMWCHRTDMIIPRHDAGATVAGERIYIIGGIASTADRILQSIECYDTRRAFWLSGVQDLPYPTRWICCVSIISKYQKSNTTEMSIR